MTNSNNLFTCLLVCLFICCKTNNEKPLIIEKDDLNKEQTIFDEEKGLVSNTDSIKNENTSLSNKKIDSITNVTKSEYLSEMMILNDKHSFWGEKNDLKNIVSKADSISKLVDDCGYMLEDSYEVWHYLNCKIEVSDEEYVFVKIDFTKSHFKLKHKEITFSENYTLENFKNDFPKAYLESKRASKNGIESFNLKDDPLSDSIYILKFEKNKLVEIRYFFPC